MSVLTQLLSIFRRKDRAVNGTRQPEIQALNADLLSAHPKAQAGAAPTQSEGFNRIQLCRGGPILFNRFDAYVGGALQAYGEFSTGESEVFRHFIEPDMVVVDAGANIGVHTLEFARLVGARGWVYAFEPQRIVFQALCANLAINQITNVSARQNGLSDTPGVLIAPEIDPAQRHNFGGVALGHGGDGEEVRVTRLDDIEFERLDFIKIDVEGMEARVLQGASKTINQHRPILFIENDRAEKSAELIQRLFDLRYDLYWHLAPIFSASNFYRNPENIFPGLVSINMLCIPFGAAIVVSGLPRILSVDDQPFPPKTPA